MSTVFVTYILQVLNLFVLFRWILRHDIQKKKYILVIGLCIVAFGLLARMLFYENMTPVFSLLVLRGALVILPALCFHVNWIKGILISANFRLITSFIFSVCGNAVGTQVILLVVQCLGMITFKNKEEENKGNSFRSELLVILMIGLMLLDNETSILLFSSDEIYQSYMSRSKVVNLMISLLFTTVITLLHILYKQKEKLAELNLLNEKCIEEQTKQYHKAIEKEQKIVSLRHDAKAHLMVINRYAKDEDINGLRGYLKELQDIADMATTYHTGSMIFDAILNQYAEEGKDSEIDILLIGQMPANVKIKETDLCVLLSNAISNAYEAARQCKGKKTILVKTPCNENYLFITIDNPSIHTIRADGFGLRSSKTGQGYHGIGTKNMQMIAKKYDGSVKWNQENETVKTTIQLRICER